MNPTRFCIRFLVLTLVASVSVWGQTWQDVTGNISGGIPIVQNIAPLATDGTYLYVNAGDGVKRTTDGVNFAATADIEGGTWRFVKVVNGEVWIGDATANLHYTYLWRSSDHGDTWNAASNGMPGEVNLASIEDIAYDSDAGNYWAASRIGGAYLSADGTNWTHTRVGLPQVFGYSLGSFVHAEGGKAMVSIVGDGTLVGGGIFRTVNGGASWSKLQDVVAGVPGNFLKIGDRILYTTSGINTLTGGLFFTEDLGDTWTYQDQWLKTAYSLSTDGTTVFACVADGGIFYSANQGDSWDTLAATGLAAGAVPIAIEKFGNYLYLFTSENDIGKLYRMDVSGVNFIASTQITLDPIGAPVLEGNLITLEGDAIGTGAVTYQWQKNGVNVAGAKSKTLTIDPIELSHAGAYTLVATANGQSATSGVATVDVIARNIGTVDPQFTLSVFINNDVEASVIDPDGNVWFTGWFTTSNNSIIKVDPVDGTVLATLGGAAEGKSAALDSMGKVWIGNNNAQLHRISPSSAAIDFTVDINLGANSGRVNQIVPVGDEGKVLIAGYFDKVAGVDTGPMALVNHDGTVDSSFDFSKAGLSVNEIKVMDVGLDGSIYVMTGNSFHPVFKLNSDGSKVADWYAGGQRNATQSNLAGELHDITVLVDGTLMLGFRGTFGTNATVIPTSQSIMHLDTDGSWINDFNVGGTGVAGYGQVDGIVQAPDGKIIIYGNFDGYVGAEATSVNKNITRLLADGSPDPYWNPGSEGWRGSVYTAVIDSSGNIFGGTDHTWYNGVNLSRILKLAGDLSPLAILSHPKDLVLDLGETATFEAIAFGTTEVSYQWRKDGVPISGATSNTLELSNIDDEDDGYYDVVVANSAGTQTTSTGRLTTISKPKFIVPPAVQTASSGDSVTLSVEAVGLGDLTYQWFFEGEAIDGATSASYTIPFAAVVNSGNYSVEVTGSQGATLSDPALVVVNSFPGALDLGFNSLVGFNNTVSSLIELEDGGLVVGGRFTQYKGVSKSYLAKLDSHGNLDESWPAATAPKNWIRTIVQQTDKKFVVGGPISLDPTWPNAIARLNEDGSLDLDFNKDGVGFSNNSAVYQLALQDDGKILVLLDPTYNANPTYNGVAVADFFRLDADGSIDETFTGVDFGARPDGFKLLRSGKIIVYGAYTTVNGESHKNIVRIDSSGFVDDTFALGADPDGRVSSVDEATDGKVIVGGWFSNLGGYERKFVALLNADGSVDEKFDTSTASGNSPSIVEGVSALLNGEFLLVGRFLSWGDLGYITPYRIATMNRLGERTGFEAGSHAGFNSDPLGAFIVDGPGYAYVAGDFSSYHGQSTGRVAKIHLESMDLVFLSQPEDQFVEAGDTATFTADVLGTTTIGYQWYKAGNLIDGATSATLEIANAKKSDAGSYTLEIVNASGAVTSAAATLHFLADPVLLSEPSSKIANAGSSLRLVAEAIGAAPLSTKWYRNGVEIEGETDMILAIDGLVESDAGIYYAEISNDLGTVSTRKVAVSVQFGAAGVDPSFNPSYPGSPGFGRIYRDGEGDYIVTGYFFISGKNHLMKLSSNGLLDTSVTAASNPNNGFSERGAFDAEGGWVYPEATLQNPLLKRLKPGVYDVDTTFNANASLPAMTNLGVKIQSDGKIVLHGNNMVIRRNADGTEDATFNVGGSQASDGQISDLAIAPDGRIGVSGYFSQFGGESHPNFVMLEADGSVDADFVSGTGFDGQVSMVAFGGDGKLYASGTFTHYNDVAVGSLVRINKNGTLDSSFAPGQIKSGVNVAEVRMLYERADGSVAIAGSFNTVGGESRPYLAALGNDGALLEEFKNLNLNGIVSDWFFEPNGTVTLSGTFYSPRNRLLRINPTPPAFAIAAQPEVFSVEVGEYARMVVAAVGQGPFSFQWKKNGEVKVGATSYYLEFDPAMVSDRGTYTVVVSNGVEEKTSQSVTPTITGYEPTPFTQWMIDQGAVGFNKLNEEDDYDGDSMSNALEYALGLDPLIPNWEDAPEAAFVRGSVLGLVDDDLYLVMTVRLKRGLSGVTVTPRAAISVAGLSTGAGNVSTVSGPTADGDFDVTVYRSSFGVSSTTDAAFMNLKVTVVFE